MSKIPCASIGRSKAAAITIAHETVSRTHAEVIPLTDGCVYVTDCASRNGTFVNEDGQWRQIRQDFAGPAARVRFGDVEMSVRDLLTEIARRQGSAGAGANAGAANGPVAGQPVARPPDKLDASQGVVRNPETGEPMPLADQNH